LTIDVHLGALAADSTTPAKAARRLPLLPVAALLREQSTMTAVERFSQQHVEVGAGVAQAKYYRDLIPLERPRPGEQYGFEVDLDQCTGCKACVVACHTLNGLDEGEMWRTVGLLHGGNAAAPAQQTVTTSCHHCVDPACMNGCPVGAYEKDALTGIVKHLDDQCFGCQYCTMMCPYDAPKYSEARGIVRKCDMCSDRLAHGEAPACVQACPNEAIAIRIVDQAAMIQASEANGFLPGAPSPEQTQPTTVYRTAKVMPNNMLPADFYVTRPEHAHVPLVIMLTLTQLSAGAFALALLVERFWGHPAGSPLMQAVFACAVALIALGASIFHLGRPWLFYRAVLGIRTSWLSREALAFGLFAQLAIVYGVTAGSSLLPEFPGKAMLMAVSPHIRVGAAIIGVLGVLFSVMVYVATRRQQWSVAETGVRFLGTSMVLGSAAVLGVASMTTNADGLDRSKEALLSLIIAAVLSKLLFEGAGLLRVRDKQQSVQRRVATVMLGDLRRVTGLRFALAVAGGLLLPIVLANGLSSGRAAQMLTVLMLLALTAAEVLERYLFFRAAPSSRMPGAIR